MIVLGINTSHNCSAALIRDGKLVAAAQEERLARRKNVPGIPAMAIEAILKQTQTSTEDIDLLAYADGTAVVIGPLSKQREPTELTGFIESVSHVLGTSVRSLDYGLPPIARARWELLSLFNQASFRRRARSQNAEIASGLSVEVGRVLGVDHHTAHASTAAFGSGYEEGLVMTLDGYGDGISATVSTFQSDELRRISASPLHSSLGSVYAAVTRHLGLKVLEDEYKVMGLAPYADPSRGVKATALLSDLIQLDTADRLRFVSKFNTEVAERVVARRLAHTRFDDAAFAVQNLTEKLVINWVRYATKKTGHGALMVSGGVFMNVKLNMVLAEMPEVENLFVAPSCGDESNCLGAAYLGYQWLCKSEGKRVSLPALETLYLGLEYPEEAVEEALDGVSSRCKVEKQDDIEGVVAELLARGNIVARFAGAMEFGARALGNRSILASAADSRVIVELNRRVKKRDFWMPFAPTILAERQNDYVSNPKGVRSPFMNMAFRATSLAVKELPAAMHQYDFTMRPQILERQHNPRYHNLIKSFESLTGSGGVLNTSFNTHGEPIVCSPYDALKTFENSGLEYLAMENYLVKKT